MATGDTVPSRRAYLGLGSNIGDKTGNITDAIARIAQLDKVQVVRRSRLYRTAPWGNENQDWFVNACLAVDTTLLAQKLLDQCLGIERQMGRQRLEKWGPRLIDIDILFYEGEQRVTNTLSLPHPLVLQRAFVLAPLNDIAPDLIIGNTSVRAALAALGQQTVTPIEG